MPFTQLEIDYLASQPLGRLATAQPDGTLQNSPVGFRYNQETGTIDIGGYNMAASRKFKNLSTNERVAFVVDDIASTSPWRVRCLEIRGTAEALQPGDGRDAPIIRVHPRRIISFGLENMDVDPHLLKPNRRDIA
ncbi:MAG TPA: PPOX class F420-dependent oxidoreductase [Candidatus Dormibacteraeota bacterium]|jgi:pyridoxamine 5'-phosphate oxidase family protein|nr:PPOX class F420-dependent oxidoreductase [Candidatus Dormibacteraeota bacterium]